MVHFIAGVFALFAVSITALELSLNETIKPLPYDQVSAFTPYTHYASAGYCLPTVTLTWTCGANCNANPHFKPVASGGDGSEMQFWFVGYDAVLDTVIVSHQGTDVDKIIPIVTDIDYYLVNLDSTLFPGINNSVEVHSGFADAQTKSASYILDAVGKTLATFHATSVTFTGHSLGAAIALLDSIYLPLHLPPSTSFKTVVYGLPRVGNQAFAEYVDTHVKLTHINNKKDPVPILPGELLGFVHPSGEVHIDDSEQWQLCPGHDNPSTECIVGAVPNIFEGNVSDHDGPYNNITMGC